jgi:hypothetical protein
MKKEPVVHYDKLGREIKLDDCVVLPSHNNLCIGKVNKLNPKMVGIKEVGTHRYLGTWNKYPSDLVIIESADLTMYLLKGTS